MNDYKENISSGFEEIIKIIISNPQKNIPFYKIIKSISGYDVLPYDGQAKDPILKIIELSGKLINREGITSKRPNEVGNSIESFVIRAIKDLGFDANPKSKKGKGSSSGYPDIEAIIEDKFFYIEIKSYNKKQENSSHRTFYFSPSANFKVSRDAYHLILSFEVIQKDQKFFMQECCVIDSRDLSCNLKCEFNSNNKKMYKNKKILNVTFF